MTGSTALAPQWTRVEMYPSATHCRPGMCRVTLKTPGGPLDVTTEARDFAVHEIPGWDSGSTAGRAASAIVQGIARREGMTSDRARIGLGTRVVSDSGGWQLHCSLFWIDDQEIQYNKTDDDHITRSARRTEGENCRVVTAADTALVRWRFRAGIAPTRDSLAMVYDSLSAAKSQAVGASPPMSLERLRTDGTVAARYDFTRGDATPTFAERMGGVRRMRVSREGGGEVAVMNVSLRTTLDLAPGTSDDEARVLRLVAATLAVPVGSTGR
jgi:hypothetical protein